MQPNIDICVHELNTGRSFTISAPLDVNLVRWFDIQNLISNEEGYPLKDIRLDIPNVTAGNAASCSDLQ